MRILCAPDSFKESIGAVAAAEAMARGAEAAGDGIIAERCPVADGGEGTMEVLLGARGGRRHGAVVTGPLGQPIEAEFGVCADGVTAIVEIAAASGLALLEPGRRDPTRTTTFGTGELIARSIAMGCERTIVALGGSATCDGGAGLAQALGVRFFDARGDCLDEPMTGGKLCAIARVEPAPLKHRILAACDVTNPLCGADGAAAIFGPQKGATPEQVADLDAGLAHLAHLAGGDADAVGAGAAGGAGFGLATLLGATLVRGIDLVLDAIDFDDRCRSASLVLTGEGRLDGQSTAGKACLGVARVAARHGVPTIALVGSTGPGFERCMETLRAHESLEPIYGRARALGETAALLERTATDVVRRWVGSPGRGRPGASGRAGQNRGGLE